MPGRYRRGGSGRGSVISGHLALALQDVDLDGGLVVRGGGEDLALLVGMVVLRSISLVNTPPRVSMPRLSGVTSNRRMPSTSPPRTPPWMAAPIATHSSGLMPLKPSLPVRVLTASWTAGIRVEPPTSRTLLRSLAFSPASEEGPGARGRWSSRRGGASAR